MAAVASGSVELDYSPGEIYRGETDPETPEDGQVVLNTTENVLKRWDATAEAYTIIADYNTMTAQIGAVEAATTGSTDFLGLLASARYAEDGLHLVGVGGTLELVLSPGRISFIDGGEEVAYITGNKLYINTAEFVAELKIGNYSLVPDGDGGLLIL